MKGVLEAGQFLNAGSPGGYHARYASSTLKTWERPTRSFRGTSRRASHSFFIISEHSRSKKKRSKLQHPSQVDGWPPT